MQYKIFISGFQKERGGERSANPWTRQCFQVLSSLIKHICIVHSSTFDYITIRAPCNSLQHHLRIRYLNIQALKRCFGCPLEQRCVMKLPSCSPCCKAGIDYRYRCLTRKLHESTTRKISHGIKWRKSKNIMLLQSYDDARHRTTIV